MSPPQSNLEDETQGNVSQSNFSLKERNYLGLTNCSSKGSTQLEDSKNNLNLKATELRLGLPGSQSPERDTKREEIALFPFLPLKDGNYVPAHKRSCPASELKGSNNSNNAPAAKAQVVGWPPIRSFRKNTLATTSKNNEEVDGKPGSGTLFVKVSMDGAPYLRKVDLKLYSNYPELSSALEKMFTCFTIGQCGSHGASGNNKLSESKLRDLLSGSEYVLTFEDKDGDWMLVGDVPWEMFIGTCKRLKIMKSSDAIGLAPRADGKSNKA